MKREIIPYNSELKQLARQLRKNSTLGEVLLWNRLKKKQVNGFDFHRQKPIDDFIVDFFCNELMLAIEIDGVSHNFINEKDIIRQLRLENLGVRFLRFTEKEIRFNIDKVVETIKNWIIENT